MGSPYCIGMISLLDSDDAERRRIALEVEKEMEAAEQKMNAAIKSRQEAGDFFLLPHVFIRKEGTDYVK